MDYELASKIDHTLLKADATEEAIISICKEAKEFHTASVCVNTCWTKAVKEELKDSGVKTCCVVGFPLGAMSTEAKAFEALQAVKDGAEEVDMVINIGRAKMHDWDFVRNDIEKVIAAAAGALVKVIIETCLLSDEEKKEACIAAKAAGADFVKTSTGFSTGGAEVADIKLMREAVGPEMGVKASGGIRTREKTLAMLEAGATRIGASATKAIIS